MLRSGFRARWQVGIRTSAAALLLAAIAAACVSAPPGGPLFVPATAPDPDDTLVYIYRADPLRGIRAVDLRLDTQDLGELQNGEYLSFLLAPGHHELAARLRWLRIIPRSWNRIAFVAQPGQTVYLVLWADYDRNLQPSSELRAASGAPANTEVGLYLAERDEGIALPQLSSMRRTEGR